MVWPVISLLQIPDDKKYIHHKRGIGGCLEDRMYCICGIDIGVCCEIPWFMLLRSFYIITTVRLTISCGHVCILVINVLSDHKCLLAGFSSGPDWLVE